MKNSDVIKKHLKLFWAETFGSFALMFFGCSGLILKVDGFPGGNKLEYYIGSIQGGLMFGFSVAAIIVAIGHLSQAHLNPAVTLQAYILGIVPEISYVLTYFLAQFLGALSGMATLKSLIPEDTYRLYSNNGSFCGTHLARGVTPLQGFFFEFIATSFLIWVICSVWDPRNKHTVISAPSIFAITITVLSSSVGTFTGCSMNPTRTLAPAIVNRNFTNHWIYWTGPMLASALTTMMYKSIYWEEASDSTKEKSDIMKSFINPEIQSSNSVEMVINGAEKRLITDGKRSSHDQRIV